MPDDLDDRLEELFHTVLKHGPAERVAFLAEACRANPSLREKVERLLAAHEKTTDFLEKPAWAMFVHPDAKEGAEAEKLEVEPGLRVIHTPGHTPGSSCLLLHRGDLKVLFTGDHILRRRDEVPAPLHFPWTFDWDAQVASARRLLDLDFDYLVPSHGARLARGYFDDAHARLESALADPEITRPRNDRGVRS